MDRVRHFAENYIAEHEFSIIQWQTRVKQNKNNQQPLISTVLYKKRTPNIPESRELEEAVGGRHGRNWPSCENKLRHPQSEPGQSPGRPSKIPHLFAPLPLQTCRVWFLICKNEDTSIPVISTKATALSNQSQTPNSDPKELNFRTSQEAWKAGVFGGNQIWVCCRFEKKVVKRVKNTAGQQQWIER